MRQDARTLLRTFAANESGATAIEYGLIAAGIAGVIIATVFSVGDSMKTLFYDKIQNAFKTLPT
jgi:pilus assembly protein Flp/PilA